MQPTPAPGPKLGLSTAVWIAIAATIGIVVLASGCVVMSLLVNAGPKPPAAAPAAPVEPTPERTTAQPSSPTSAAPTVVVMPDLVKKNAAIARDELTRLGFTNIQMGSRDKDDKIVILASNWTVVDQSTPAGTQVSIDTLIVLGCSKKQG